MEGLLAHATSIITYSRRGFDASGYGFDYQDVNKSFYTRGSHVAVLPGAYSVEQVAKAIEAKAVIYTHEDDTERSLSRLLMKSGYAPRQVQGACEWRLLKIRQLEMF